MNNRPIVLSVSPKFKCAVSGHVCSCRRLRRVLPTPAVEIMGNVYRCRDTCYQGLLDGEPIGHPAATPLGAIIRAGENMGYSDQAFLNAIVRAAEERGLLDVS